MDLFEEGLQRATVDAYLAIGPSHYELESFEAHLDSLIALLKQDQLDPTFAVGPCQVRL